MNLELLHILSRFYKHTLRSVMWIDSLSNVPGSWKFLRPSHNPDPLVLITWLCTQFEELVLYGYKYPEENLVAIGRLKGSRMKKLEIPSNEIVTESIRYRANPIKVCWCFFFAENVVILIMFAIYRVFMRLYKSLLLPGALIFTKILESSFT